MRTFVMTFQVKSRLPGNCLVLIERCRADVVAKNLAHADKLLMEHYRQVGGYEGVGILIEDHITKRCDAKDAKPSVKVWNPQEIYRGLSDAWRAAAHAETAHE